MARIWDFCEADLSLLDVDTVRVFSMYSMTFSKGINDVKVAFVVKEDLELDLLICLKDLLYMQIHQMKYLNQLRLPYYG